GARIARRARESAHVDLVDDLVAERPRRPRTEVRRLVAQHDALGRSGRGVDGTTAAGRKRGTVLRIVRQLERVRIEYELVRIHPIALAVDVGDPARGRSRLPARIV